MPEEKRYNIIVSATTPDGLPADAAYLLLYAGDEYIAASRQFPTFGKWGEAASINISLSEGLPMPDRLDMAYLSAAEQKFYMLETPLPTSAMEHTWAKMTEQDSSCRACSIIVGMAPFGGVAVWLSSPRIQELVGWYKGEEVNIAADDFFQFNRPVTVAEMCMKYMEHGSQAALLPKRISRLMTRFSYCICVQFGQFDDEGNFTQRPEQLPEAANDSITVRRFDGSYYKIADNLLSACHKTAKPENINLAWRVGKAEYMAYFHLDEQATADFFDKFYGAHSDTPSEFIIRIDPESRKYGLAMFRAGLPEPAALPANAYQMIVFKNDFEDYRSPNYNQPDGAWNW